MKFLRWVLIICLILLVAVCTAKFNGQTNPANFSSFGLDVCGGKPCFMGIVPGETKWEDVPFHLKGQKFIFDEDSGGVWITDHIEPQFERFPDETTVTLITISDSTILELFPTTFPPVGDFILKYGEPCLVLIDTHGQSKYRLNVSRLVYPTMTVDVDIAHPFVPSAPVGSVQIMAEHTTEYPDNLCKNETNIYHGLSWIGFASHYIYKDAYLKKQTQRQFEK